TGAKTGLITATFIQGMTGSLDDILTLKKVIKGAGEVIGNGKNTQNNNPYNVLSQTEQQKKEAIDMLKNGWEGLLGQMQGINLSSEAGSMSEATRSNAYNTGNVSSEINSKKPENFDNSFRTKNINNSSYIENIEIKNRNNMNSVSKIYTNSDEVELMIKNSIDKYTHSKIRFK
ncbi:MAG: hypothetical protein Q4D53_05145, partial [Leptotrichiaceae bacterium]|nr:hypothetical protein [Leptotrichiaceae bacterium]